MTGLDELAELTAHAAIIAEEHKQSRFMRFCYQLEALWRASSEVPLHFTQIEEGGEPVGEPFAINVYRGLRQKVPPLEVQVNEKLTDFLLRHGQRINTFRVLDKSQPDGTITRFLIQPCWLGIDDASPV